MHICLNDDPIPFQFAGFQNMSHGGEGGGYIHCPQLLQLTQINWMRPPMWFTNIADVKHQCSNGQYIDK